MWISPTHCFGVPHDRQNTTRTPPKHSTAPHTDELSHAIDREPEVTYHEDYSLCCLATDEHFTRNPPPPTALPGTESHGCQDCVDGAPPPRTPTISPGVPTRSHLVAGASSPPRKARNAAGVAPRGGPPTRHGLDVFLLCFNHRPFCRSGATACVTCAQASFRSCGAQVRCDCCRRC